MSSVVIIIGEPEEGEEKKMFPPPMTVSIEKPGVTLNKSEVLEALKFATVFLEG